VACGRSQPKEQLLRFVRGPDGELTADPQSTAPGRGAYLCVREECAERALAAPAAFSRSFRAPVKITAESIQSVSRWRRSAFTR
jgi:predicted RNA-binding protein YlxR (DUF448 family)